MKIPGSNLSRYYAPRLVGVVAFALLIVNCAGQDSTVQADNSSSQPRAQSTSGTSDTVLAVVGSQEIMASEVEELVSAAILKAARDKHIAMENGLSQLVQEKLLEIEAEAEGISPEELIQRDVELKVVAPSDEQVDQFYEQNKARMEQSKEELAPQIEQYLSNQQRQGLLQGLVAGLEKKHGVESFLEPLRIPIKSQGFPFKGPENAPVTLVEFSDFQCPYCGRVIPTLEKLADEYGDNLRIVFRQFPLNSIHPNAQKAAEGSLCANDQGKFWEMHDTLFKEQRSLGIEQLKEKAVRLGMDSDLFNECLDSGQHAAAVAADLMAGSAAGVTGTPAMFINGRFLSGAQPYEAIAEIVDSELEKLGE